MLAVSADANTSAGAPWLICVTSDEDAAKLNVTFAPGLAASNAVPISLNESVSDAAANTVRSPVTLGAPVVVGAVVAGELPAVVAGPVVVEMVAASSPQPAVTSPKERGGRGAFAGAVACGGTIVSS